MKAYKCVKNQRLREYPTGMSLAVPPVLNNVTVSRGGPNWVQPPTQPAATAIDQVNHNLKVRFDTGRNEVIFDVEKCPVRAGDWVVLTCPSKLNHVHLSIKYQ